LGILPASSAISGGAQVDGISEKLIPHKTFTGDRPSLSGQSGYDVVFGRGGTGEGHEISKA